MNSNVAAKAKQLMDDQIDLISQLQQLLTEEYATLNHVPVDELERLAGEKQSLVSQLEQINHNWQDMLHALSTEFTLEGIPKKLKEIDSGNAFGLLDRWKKLGELSHEVQKQNRVNSAVVTLRQQVTEQAMNILRGQSVGGTTYGKEGKERSLNTGGHTIAKA